MKKLERILFITEENIKLTANGEAFEATRGSDKIAHIPTHDLEGIVSYSFDPATPAVFEKCADKHIAFYAMSRNGSIRYIVTGETRKNIEVRKKQYILNEDKSFRLSLEKSMISAKISNCANIVTKYKAQHPASREKLIKSEASLYQALNMVKKENDENKLRGIEGFAARSYFDGFPEMICPADIKSTFNGRNRRPPKDPCNILLSLAYTALTSECISALEMVGLDPYAGILHGDRHGKPSLALDMMEELRPVIADKLVLRLLNLNMIGSGSFEFTGDKVAITKNGIKIFYTEWSKQREKECFLPELGIRIQYGLLPFIQAKKLANIYNGTADLYVPINLKENK